MLNLLIIMKTK